MIAADQRDRRRRRLGAGARRRLPPAPDKASFAFLFTKVGLAGADMGSAYLLPRVVGLGRATELLMLGDKARRRDRPCEIGLAN